MSAVAYLPREEPAVVAPYVEPPRKWRAEVCVLGKPPSQGSKRAYVVKGRAILVEDQKGLRSWQQECMEQLRAQCPATTLAVPNGPIAVALTVYVQRPKSHYGTGKNTARLRSDAPGPYACGTPDLDKIQRAVGDALIGIVVRDDSQIAVWRDPSRYYADEVSPRVEVEIFEL